MIGDGRVHFKLAVKTSSFFFFASFQLHFLQCPAEGISIYCSGSGMIEKCAISCFRYQHRKVNYIRQTISVVFQGFLLKLKYSVTMQCMNWNAPWLSNHFCKMENTMKLCWNPDWYIGSRFFSLMKRHLSHGCCRSPVRDYLHTHQSPLKALTALEMDASLRIVQQGPDLSLSYALPSYSSAARSVWLIQLLAESPTWSEKDLEVLCLGGFLDVWQSCFTLFKMRMFWLWTAQQTIQYVIATC